MISATSAGHSGAESGQEIPLALGLIGFPLGHSLSPVLHAAALAACSLPGEYQLYPVPSLPEGKELLVNLLRRMRAGGLHGLNVTIPHKQNVIPFLDRLSPAAAAIRAVNTIYLRDQALIGENTDAPGFAAALQRAFEEASFQAPAGCSALVLGAGGSARAVVYALAGLGWQVTLAARRQEQAELLLEQVVNAETSARHTAILLDAAAIAQRLTEGPLVSLVVNTTPLGMSPQVDGNPWPLELPLAGNAFLYDLVYNPRATALVKLARQAGMPAAGGLGMLVEQAARSFEYWTGRTAPLDAMYQAVASD